MSNLNHFTIPQLKKLAKHFDLKGIKISVRKSELIDQIDKYIHFDGYQIHLKDSNEDNLVKPDILKKESHQYIKTKKGDINNKQMLSINQSIKNIIGMLGEKPKPKPQKIKIVNPKSKTLIDDPTKDFNTEKELLDYLDYLQIDNYSAYQRTVNKLIDYHKKGVKLHLNVYNQLI